MAGQQQRKQQQEESQGRSKTQGEETAMRTVLKEMVLAAGDSVGVGMNEGVAEALAPDAECRLREILETARKLARHGKRSRMAESDINGALRLRRAEPIYGAGSVRGVAEAEGGIHAILDEEVDLSHEARGASLPKPPAETNVVAHWLAVEGVQPAVPENPRQAGPPSSNQELEEGSSVGVAGGGEARGPVGHALPRELRIFGERIGAAIGGEAGERGLMAALEALERDTGMGQLAPYLARLVGRHVQGAAKDLRACERALAACRALANNPSVDLAPHLHALMPPLITCAVAKTELPAGGERAREEAARTLTALVRRYEQRHPSVRPRASKALARALLQPTRPPASSFGACLALQSLGPRAVLSLLLPNAPDAARRAAEAFSATNDEGAALALAALRSAVGCCLHGRLLASGWGSFYPPSLPPSSRPPAPDHLRARVLEGREEQPAGGGGTKAGDEEGDGNVPQPAKVAAEEDDAAPLLEAVLPELPGPVDAYVPTSLLVCTFL